MEQLEIISAALGPFMTGAVVWAIGLGIITRAGKEVIDLVDQLNGPLLTVFSMVGLSCWAGRAHTAESMRGMRPCLYGVANRRR